MQIQPIVLHGKIVRLEPMTLEHVPQLAQIGNDPSIWAHMVYGQVLGEPAMWEWVRKILQKQDQKTDLPFVVIHQQTNQVAGATRYMEIRPEHRGLEIGGTWYGTAYQRTGVNTESKYLLLKHAFEVMGCIRVQFKTDTRNLRSQKAIERIGAQREGILRKQVILPDGYIRSSVYYSIVDDEWPAVKRQLEQMMQRFN